jgi:carbamoylphosphate synthase large subunit
MLADRDLIDQLVDKRRFQALAARLDLPVPPSQHLRPAPGDPCQRSTSVPVVVKPLTRAPAWSALAGSSKALSVPGRKDLAALWPRARRASPSAATHSVAVRNRTRWPARQARIPSAITRWLLPVPGGP